MAVDATLARRAGSEDRIVFLGHATVLIEIDGVCLLTDPLLRDRIAHLRRLVAPVEQSIATEVDGVLISHLHRDHLDLPSLRSLGFDTPLFVPRGGGAWLGHRGFTRVRELSVGETAQVGEGTREGQSKKAGSTGLALSAIERRSQDTGAGALAVTAVEAHHDGRRRPGPGGTRAATVGYLVDGAQKTVYFAGDTELFDGMSALASAPDSAGQEQRSTTALDVALLPVAGWGPTLGPGHMGPLEAARAAAMLRPRIAIPMHWGTFAAVGVRAGDSARREDPARRFAEELARLDPAIEVRVLAPGEQTEL